MKTVLITGATAGIGRETARQLLGQGFRVIIHGRTPEKANCVIDELKAEIPFANADSVYGDLSVMRDVADVAEHVKARTTGLAVLINKLVIYDDNRGLAGDGFESTVAVS